jgi:hypothetical protein
MGPLALGRMGTQCRLNFGRRTSCRPLFAFNGRTQRYAVQEETTWGRGINFGQGYLFGHPEPVETYV